MDNKKRPINKENLDMLNNNQKMHADEPPITYCATFKLSLLQDLINEIIKNPEYDKGADERYNHYVCISLVREKIAEMHLYDERHVELLKKNASPKNKLFSQLIPILSGCVCKLDPAGITQSFKYMSKSDGETEVIEVIRPGGEGTGLIPPPPPRDGK